MGIKRDAADAAFSDVVRCKANWSCEHCSRQFNGRSAGLHCAHIYGRANKRVRWSLDNAVSLCAYCHRYFTENPLEFHSWLESYLGHGHIEMLNEKRREVFKTNKLIRSEVASHYREQFSAMDDNQEFEPVSYN